MGASRRSAPATINTTRPPHCLDGGSAGGVVFYIPADLPRVGTVSEALSQQCPGASVFFRATPFPQLLPASRYQYRTGVATLHCADPLKQRRGHLASHGRSSVAMMQQ